MNEELYAQLSLMLSRRQAWDCYFSGLMSISLHPGTTRDQATPRTPAQCALIADEMLAQRTLRVERGDL